MWWWCPSCRRRRQGTVDEGATWSVRLGGQQQARAVRSPCGECALSTMTTATRQRKSGPWARLLPGWGQWLCARWAAGAGECWNGAGTLTRESVGEKERNVLRVAGTVAVHWERAVCRLYRLAQRAHGHSQYCQLRRREGAFADVQTRAQRGSTSCGGCKLIRVGDGGSQQMDEGSHGARRRRRRIATLAL